MFEDRVSPNPFAAINPKKLLHYGFVKRVRQTFNVFYGGFDRQLDAHAGIFDWLTLGMSILAKRGVEACHAKAQQASPLYYVPYALLGLPHLVFKALRIVFSAVMTAVSFLLVVLFHAVAASINCCSNSKEGISFDVQLRSPAKIEKAIGNTAHELGKGLSEITHQVQSPDGRGKKVKDKVQETVSSSKQKLWKTGKQVAHKVKKETNKFVCKQ